MVYIKTPEEIKVLRAGGLILSNILKRLLSEVRPGVETMQLEDLADSLIGAAGGRAAFKNYPMGGGIFFPSVLCVSLNNEVVHGAAWPNRIIKNGDIVDLDIGMEWPVDLKLRQRLSFPTNSHSKNGGYFTDTCATIGVGKISAEARRLLRVTAECLERGIAAARPNRHLNEIGRAVQTHAESYHYGVVRDLVGHGVGYYAHEEPDVFNFIISDKSRENIILQPGMVLAIEPMINLGDWPVEIADNNYTIVTADGSLSAHFEHTIVITSEGCERLT